MDFLHNLAISLFAGGVALCATQHIGTLGVSAQVHPYTADDETPATRYGVVCADFHAPSFAYTNLR